MTDSALAIVPQTATPEGMVNFAPLSDFERAWLEAEEEKIEGSLEAFYNIKVNNLWREFGSFREYMAKRWGYENRRVNQLIAGYRVIITLTEALQGTGVPVISTEYPARPLGSLIETDPAKAVEIYKAAVELAGGEAPSHNQVFLARQMIMTPDEVRREQAIVQLRAMEKYDYLIDEIKTGGDPVLTLGLATALDACQVLVRRACVQADVRDLALIRLLNEAFVNGREMAKEIVLTGYLQAPDWSVPLSRASARDFRRLADQKRVEHIQEQIDARRGEPVSIVVYNYDVPGTLNSLKQALSYTTLIALGNLIGEL